MRSSFLSGRFLPLFAVCAALVILSFAPARAAGPAAQVLYGPQTETPNGLMPLEHNYELVVTSPANFPVGGSTTATFEITPTLNPLTVIAPLVDIRDFVVITLKAGQPTAFTGPNQSITYNVSLDFPLFVLLPGQTSLVYAYKVKALGWPMAANTFANAGHDISATASVPPADAGDPPTVTILTPAQGQTFAFTQGNVPATIPLQFDAVAAATHPVTSVDADLAGPFVNGLPGPNYTTVILSVTTAAGYPLNSAQARGLADMPIPGAAAPGEYTYRVTTRGANSVDTGEAVHEFVIKVMAEAAPPAVDISTPTDGQIFNVAYSALNAQGEASIPLAFTATANVTYPVTEVAWSVDGGAEVVQAMNAAVVNATGTMLVKAGNSAGQGNHTVDARAKNSVGSATDSHDFSVRVTGAPPPVVVISQPTATTYQFLKRADPLNDPYLVLFAFSAESVANGGLIRSVVATLDNSSTPLSLTTSALDAKVVTGSATLPFTSGGSHSVQVSAIDDYGTAVATTNFQIVILDPKPTIDITIPADGAVLMLPANAATMNVAFSFRTQSTEPFKVVSVSGTIDGDPVSGITTPNLGTIDAVSTGTFANLGVGSHTFIAKGKVQAVGVAGEVEVTDTVTFEIRRPIAQPQPPTVVINTPPENSIYTRASTGPAISIPLSFTGTSNVDGGVITALTATVGSTTLTVSSTTLNQKIATGTATITVSAAGTYTITVTATDAVDTAVATRTFTVVVTTPKTVSGKVFFDVDYDGTFDSAEFGLACITVKLLNASNQVIACDKTNASGCYSFSNVAPGSYVVTATPYAGLSATNSNERAITVGTSNVSVSAIGFGLNFDALQAMKADGYSHGFWKNNVDKAIANKSGGAQVSAAKVKAYTAEIGDLALSPYDDITLKQASAILSSKSSKANDLLSKQLLASEYNYAHGSYINGSQSLTYVFISWGEHVLKNSSSYSTSYVLWAKDWFDAYNNSHGGSVAGPTP